MARKRGEPDKSRFFASLNSADDLTAVIHGMATLEAMLGEALSLLLKDQGLRVDLLDNLRFLERVAALMAAGRLDAETYPLFAHLANVRNRFAHELQTTITDGEGRDAWDRLPQRAKDRARPQIRRSSPPGRVVRWCIVVLWARIGNRGIAGEGPDLPYS